MPGKRSAEVIVVAPFWPSHIWFHHFYQDAGGTPQEAVKQVEPPEEPGMGEFCPEPINVNKYKHTYINTYIRTKSETSHFQHTT